MLGRDLPANELLMNGKRTYPKLWNNLALYSHHITQAELHQISWIGDRHKTRDGCYIGRDIIKERLSLIKNQVFGI